MARPLGRETVTILTAPLLTNPRDNSKYYDWDNPVQTPIRGCSVQPFILSEKYNAEDDRERNFARELLRVWLPAGTAVGFENRALYQGVEYDVHGIPGDWHRSNGAPHHKTILLRRRVG